MPKTQNLASCLFVIEGSDNTVFLKLVFFEFRTSFFGCGVWRRDVQNNYSSRLIYHSRPPVLQCEAFVGATKGGRRGKEKRHKAPFASSAPPCVVLPRNPARALFIARQVGLATIAIERHPWCYTHLQIHMPTLQLCQLVRCKGLIVILYVYIIHTSKYCCTHTNYIIICLHQCRSSFQCKCHSYIHAPSVCMFNRSWKQQRAPEKEKKRLASPLTSSC